MHKVVLLGFTLLVLAEFMPSKASSVEAENGIATGGELNFSAACKGLNVAHARLGNCGYGCFLGYSFGSERTFGQSLVPLKHGSMVDGEGEKYLSLSIKTNYCGFTQMELIYDERRKLGRIVLSATGNEEQMLKLSKSVKRDLALTYGFRQQDWAKVSRGTVHGVCAMLPGGLEVLVLGCRNSSDQMQLEVIVQNRRVSEPIKKITEESGDVKVDIDV